MSSRTCLISAAEPSGDHLAAGILKEVSARHPQLSWVGCQGPAMAAVRGVEFRAAAQVSQLSAAGLLELLPRLPALFAARRGLQDLLRASPELAIFVDAPDFHLPLAARARDHGIPTVVVVPPQWWAWRPGRLAAMHRYADLVLCLFDFEVNPLRARGVAAHWIGHPAADLLTRVRPPLSGETGSLRIALLPGSRPSEVQRYLQPMVVGVRTALKQVGRSAVIEVPWRLERQPPSLPGVHFQRAPGPTVLERSDLALVAAGTASLEAAALGVPMVIAAAAHPVTAAIARPLLRDQALGLPNILLNEQVVTEVHQDLRPDSLSAALSPLIDEPGAARRRAVAIRERLRPHLGLPGFAARAAEFIEPLVTSRA